MKICTWGNVACALKGKTEGGGELQIALLAKALAKAGNEVVVIDYVSKTGFFTPEGIKVIPLKEWNKGIKFLRTLTNRPWELYKNLKAQKADIYYCQIRDFRHQLAYRAARRNKARFVIQLASDLDAMGFRMRLKHDYLTSYDGLWWFFRLCLTEIFFPGLLRKADLVLVQHEGQKEILRKKGIRSVIYNNLIELDKLPETQKPEKKDFVYVGALDKRKGFMELYDLVNKCPSCEFKVIGSPRDKTGYSYFEKLKSNKNVTLYGKLCHSETLTHILNSKALISTSPMEGFPNIFIEAWACGIPVLSLSFDPGSTIEKEHLGIVANGNINAMVKAMASIKNGYDFSKKAKDYVIDNFAMTEKRIKETDLLFRNILNGN
jgi:glycosyltransferase involved in cell wall biosynthesis